MRTPTRTALPSACLIALALSIASSGAVQAHGKKKDDGHDAEASASELDREQHPWGVAAAPEEATRTVAVSMSDAMAFTPASIEVRAGETVTFSVGNEGTLMHEFVLGTSESLEEHAAMMLKFPGMEHDEPYMAHVPPGETGEITWTFNRDGTVEFACLVAGHYEAGMRGAVAVVPAAE